MVILAATEQHALAHAERCFIRWLSPVYNVNGVVSSDGMPRAVVRLLGAAASEDVRLVASKLLRKNRPRLPLHVWPVLVAQVVRTGDRELAAKLARQARQLHPQLGRLCAVPRLVFPCPVPAQVLKQLRVEVKAALMGLPFVRRAPQFAVVLEGTAVCWERTPFAEAALACDYPLGLSGTLPVWSSPGFTCGRLFWQRWMVQRSGWGGLRLEGRIGRGATGL